MVTFSLVACVFLEFYTFLGKKNDHFAFACSGDILVAMCMQAPKLSCVCDLIIFMFQILKIV